MSHIRLLGAIAVLVPASLAAASPQTAPATKEKVVCKSFSQIGSLVARDKVCKTKKEWDAHRAELRQRQSASGSCSGESCGGTGK